MFQDAEDLKKQTKIMTKTIEKKRMEVQPFIQLNETPDTGERQFCLHVDDASWKFDSLLTALDVLFKMTNLLNLEYMEPCEPFYEFMGNLIYGLPLVKSYDQVRVYTRHENLIFLSKLS